MENTYICKDCKEEKALNDFYKSRHQKMLEYPNRNYKCKKCTQVRNVLNRHNRMKDPELRQEFLERKKLSNIRRVEKHGMSMGTFTRKRAERSIENFCKYKLRNCRNRAKEKGMEFNLTLDLLVELFNSQNGKCALEGVKLNFESHNLSCASVDRIDCSKGYTIDNLQFVTIWANFAKHKTDIKEFISRCCNVCKNTMES